MHRFVKVFFLVSAFLLAGKLQAQELLARVTVDASQVQSIDPRIFRDMETAIGRFFNDTKWTDDDYGYNEKIRVNIQIVLKDPTAPGNYTGSLIIQSARPVYNSSYTTSTFFFRDIDFAFQYVESQPMDFNSNSYNSNLTSMLGFYANIILGMDYDSFERLGGTVFFERAENISRIAREFNSPGWDPAGGGKATKNRGSLIQNIMNTQLQPVRQLMYDYHRLGLDTFTESPEESRKVVLAGLEKLAEVRRYNPGSVLLSSFLDAKDDELTNMFTKGDLPVRRKAFELLSTMDPGKAEDYRKMLN